MKKRLREAGRLLIAAVDDSQRALGTRQGVEPTGGDGMTMQCAVQIDLDVWVGVPQGITFYEGPSCDGVIRLCCAYFQATSSLAHWTRVLSHGGHPLRHIVVDSTMGQMRKHGHNILSAAGELRRLAVVSISSTSNKAA